MEIKIEVKLNLELYWNNPMKVLGFKEYIKNRINRDGVPINQNIMASEVKLMAGDKRI